MKSAAPTQSRLKHLQKKDIQSWQEGKARILKIIDEVLSKLPIMETVAAGGLNKTFADINKKFRCFSSNKKEKCFCINKQWRFNDRCLNCY